MIDFKKITKRFFEVPAEVLEKTLQVAEKEKNIIINKKPFKVVEEYLDNLGPGLIAGAADDDPSGITTYSQAGSQYGFQLLWLSLFTFPFMAIVQSMCARIGLVTGQGLAANIREHFSHKILYFVTILLFITNTLNIAADLGAMAASTILLIPKLNFSFLVIFFAIGSLLFQIFTTYARYSRFLKYLTIALFSYVLTAFAIHLDWGSALRSTIIPSISFSKDQIFILCAVLGTTISPYLFFWQTSQEVEEKILRGEKTIQKRRENIHPHLLKRMNVDVWSGMFFSNLIMFFIIAVSAATLHASGITSIMSADQAAMAIRPFGGEFTYFFFAIGIIGTGLLAVPVLAGSTAYAIAESFNWSHGLYRKLNQAYAFYGVIIVSMIIGLVANLAHFDPIKGLIYSAVLNGLVAPIILFFVVSINGNENIMREHRSHPFTNALGWLITIVMTIAGIATIYSFLF
ncbi:MAG: Nramp family divalent metal transporter [Candidatus Vogelbacteria bacterium]|nr:Nramp family divalent metal transporter [Candidatus Vogelbacteria bacterium]